MIGLRATRILFCLVLALGLIVSRQALAQDEGHTGDTPQASGHNEKFLDPELDVERYSANFESESREVFALREAITAAMGLEEGMTVADVGAGTGAYLDLMVTGIGPSGHYFGVEISPRFAEHIRDRAVEAGYDNVTSVLSAFESVTLPAGTFDLVFVCDTYHHFDNPQAMLASIWRACKPGASLIIVDFDKVPGQSRSWILEHVRATQEEFAAEIESAGFELVEAVEIEGLEENFFLRFRRP